MDRKEIELRLEQAKKDIDALVRIKEDLEKQLKPVEHKDGNVYKHKYEGNYRVLKQIKGAWYMIAIHDPGMIYTIGSSYTIDPAQITNFDWILVGNNLKRL